MNWLEEYKKSLKNVHAEEWLDVYFYRPQAYIIVRALFNTNLTPNDFSMMALIAGVLSAYFFLTVETFPLGALFFYLFAVLDCADGMVARLKKNGTEFGRLIDGIVDYLVNIIVYFAIAICAYRNAELNSVLPWYLVIFAGVSKAIHSATFDKYLMEYLAYEKGEIGFIEKELQELNNKLQNTNAGDWKRKLAIRVYILYTKAQIGNVPKELKYNPSLYCEYNKFNLRMWGLIGPAVHILILVLAMAFMMPKLLFIYSVVLGNIWLVVMNVIQKQSLNKIEIQSTESVR